MEIGIDDLDFNEEFEKEEIQDPQEIDDNSNELEESHEEINEQDDIITLLLKDKNINDPSKIKFEDEDGNIEERDWNSLSSEEQLNILKTSNESDNDLDDAEINLINQLRLNQMSPEEFINYIKQQGIAEYTQSLEDNNIYEIDKLSDDELFILDLQSRIEDITDEEATNALNSAKENQELFVKQINGIRNEYKKLEDERIQQMNLEKQQEDSQKFDEFKDSIIDSIQNLDKIGSFDLELDEDDMNEVANFILSSDNAGVNYFSKALNDPQTLVKMAWFALKGEEAIDSISNYFTEEIKKVSQSRYEQGLKDGREGKTKKTTVYINKQTSKKNNNELSIDDLD